VTESSVVLTAEVCPETAIDPPMPQDIAGASLADIAGCECEIAPDGRNI
jgi:hypothetical protein